MMKYRKIQVLILALLFIYNPAKSQHKLDSINIKNANSLSLEVDFNRLNSIKLNEIEIQAYLCFLKKDFENAAKLYLSIIDHKIDDANVYYRLSLCYAMMENSEYAINFLTMAVNYGFNDFSKIRNEDCFKLIKNNEYFKTKLNDILNYGEKFGETIYVEANVLIKCRLILPKNYNPDKSYSLLIGLHGYGGNAEDFSFISNYIESDNFIFVVPEAPYLKNNSENIKYQYSWDYKGSKKELYEKSDTEVMKYIIKVVDQINKNYKIDKNYILGFSQGGAYAYATGIKNSDKLDAIIVFGAYLRNAEKYPWFLSKEDLIKGKNLKIFIAHGKNDAAIGSKYAIEAKRKLAKLNYDVELFLFNGGHIVDEEAMKKALKWLDKPF